MNLSGCANCTEPYESKQPQTLQLSYSPGMYLVLLLVLLAVNGCSAPPSMRSESDEDVHTMPVPDGGSDISGNLDETTLPPPAKLGDQVELEGVIVGMLEKYPPTLQVKINDKEQYFVGLTLKTKIFKNGELVDIADISSGQRIHVTGILKSVNAVTATAIRILL